MPDPSPWSHLYRLAAVLSAGFAVFLAFLAIAAPSSWHYDMGYWHRADSLEEMKRQPLIYGGIESVSASKRNAACKACHQDVTKEVRKLKHKTLSCESCHGPLFDHAREGKKIANAYIDRSTWQCENCHLAMINKPADHRQFRTTEEFNKHVAFRAGELEAGTTCLKCHSPHDPTP